ncbi:MULTISPECIES: hydrogenase maturation protease [unclassified Campylobacter]|uniref:hydrogenase maturation protease n=1 Tax=unclassified Campylobacter TaxID=2593542 RepID=UPI0022E9E1E0|nr:MULTISPECIES: hydrogenase maturation protease [unclassified Campylobacter]MDA3063108.1 hydrogenase maturation protease [Campylobacter sp. JMF_14 EL1]MDA3074174.1 hydrogenase maturation protease [Campylobacter sp. JMF_10 EL2]
MKKAILCVGNELRGDDGVGIEVGKIALEELKEWKVFFGNDMPENEFSKIRAYAPEILVAVDAIGVIMDENAKFECEFVDLSDDVSYFYSAHNIPACVWIKYLREFIPKILFLGIKVDLLNLGEFSSTLSQTAKTGALLAIEKIKELDKNLQD